MFSIIMVIIIVITIVINTSSEACTLSPAISSLTRNLPVKFSAACDTFLCWKSRCVHSSAIVYFQQMITLSYYTPSPLVAMRPWSEQTIAQRTVLSYHWTDNSCCAHRVSGNLWTHRRRSVSNCRRRQIISRSTRVQRKGICLRRSLREKWKLILYPLTVNEFSGPRGEIGSSPVLRVTCLPFMADDGDFVFAPFLFPFCWNQYQR